MIQNLHFITLGVKDLDKMKAFYRDVFGWTPLRDLDGIVFFKLNSFILALYPENKLADDIGVSGSASGFKKFSLSINFNSEKEVDDAFNDLVGKGAKLLREPERVFWGGYRGYISDIEANYWELAFNPFLTLDSDGNVVSHS